jgi:ABC-type transport system involved in multi-copper enzyme maturation permease subunit
MNGLRRLGTWIRFVVSEYSRSGRILIELTLTIAMWGLFFQRQAVPITMPNMFSLVGMFSIALALYTTSAILSMSDRPQSYLLLTRPLGRSGFLAGLYCAAVVIVWTMVLVLITLTVIVNRPQDLAFGRFLLGLLPIMLNVGLLCALMLLLSSLVVRNSIRLALLAILAIALYSNTWNLASFYNSWLAPAQSIFSRLIEPAIKGQRLAISQDYSGGGGFVLLAQIALTLLLLSLAILSFSRRELILGKK